MITQSSDLWHELSNLAAFEDTAYDEELKLSIAAALDIDTRNIEKDLQLKSISVEQLLTVFLDALKPFSNAHRAIWNGKRLQQFTRVNCYVSSSKASNQIAVRSDGRSAES